MRAPLPFSPRQTNSGHVSLSRWRMCCSSVRLRRNRCVCLPHKFLTHTTHTHLRKVFSGLAQTTAKPNHVASGCSALTRCVFVCGCAHNVYACSVLMPLQLVSLSLSLSLYLSLFDCRWTKCWMRCSSGRCNQAILSYVRAMMAITFMLLNRKWREQCVCKLRIRHVGRGCHAACPKSMQRHT